MNVLLEYLFIYQMNFRISHFPNRIFVRLYNNDDFIGKYEINKSINYLYNLFVVKKKRNNGYGKDLIEHAKAQNKIFCLEVNGDNEIAKKLYNKCGLNKTIPYYNSKSDSYKYHWSK